ncbi:MAG: YcxB family protein [Acidobacteria bacterium]|nr:YcxB family protein [Acidobacteriota bacterium]
MAMDPDAQRPVLLKLAYRLEPRDTITLLRYPFLKRKQVVLTVTLVVLVCFSVWFLSFRNLDNLVDLLLFACGFSFLFGIFRSVWQNVKRLEQGVLDQYPVPDEGLSNQITLTKNGIRLQAGLAVSEFPWESVQNWVKTMRHIIVLLKTGPGLVIPRAQIQPESQTALLEILRQRIH